MAIIEANHISKSYPLRGGARALLGRGGLAAMARGQGKKTFNALEDVSLSVEAGESLGIIGRNGSGKSTLLKILAGVTLPTAGTVRVEGRVASLLELGAGFHPMLTGRENVYLNAGLLGMRHAAVDEVFDDIVAFSGIAEFIDQPVDTYSSGMYVRIAFAVAVHANPDIFLVDEVLAVGDEEFQRQCRVKIGELKEAGKTIVFVSHDLGIVNTLCDRVVLLDHGSMIARDSAQTTIDFYLRQIGRASGIHTMKDGRLEAIFSHGRLAVFADGKEVTAPGGWNTYLSSFGQAQLSSYAEWEILERSATGCRVRGQMPRLPAALELRIALDEDRVHYSATLDAERPVPIEHFGTNLLLPTPYQDWAIGERDGVFPEILPSDTGWTNVAPPASGISEITLLPESDSMLPPLTLHCESQDFQVIPRLDNSDYMTGARVAAVQANVPSAVAQLEGRTALFGIALELGKDLPHARALMAERRAASTIETGALRAQVRNGEIRLAAGAVEVSAGIHAHVQLKLQGQWCMSQSLVWSAARRDAGAVHSVGDSLRFPFHLHYTVRPLDDGLALQVHLESATALQVEEYNFSLALQPGYSAWHTDTERGEFPPVDPAQQEWRHLNTDFHPGHCAGAEGDGLPSVTLEIQDDAQPMRMTAVQTPIDLHCQILQAIAVPERASHIRFEVGRHLIFDGRIRVQPD